MPLVVLSAVEAARNPTVKYNAADGSRRSYGAKVEALAVRPTTPAAITSVTEVNGAGTLGAIAASYRYTVIGSNGIESLPSAAAATAAMTGIDNAVDIVMPAVTGAKFYRVYTTVARTAGTELLLDTVAATGSPVTYRDTGALTPAGALPSGALPTGSVILRIPSKPGSSQATSPMTLVAVEAATTVGQAGRYEYRRV